MTIEQVRNILKGNFQSAADRQYWESKLADMERKARTAEQNNIYRSENIVYDR